MAFANTELKSGTLLTASGVTLWTATTKTIVSNILISNTDTSDHTYTLYVIPAGQSAGDQYAVLGKSSPIPASTVSNVPLEMVVPSGTFIQGFADTTNKVAIHMSGVEIS